MSSLRDYIVSFIEFAVGLALAILGVVLVADQSVVWPVSLLAGGVILCVSSLALAVNMIAFRSRAQQDVQSLSEDLVLISSARIASNSPRQSKVFRDAYRRLVRGLKELGSNIVTISDESAIYAADTTLLGELPSGSVLRATFLVAEGNPQFEFPTFWTSINEQIRAHRDRNIRVRRLYVFDSEDEYHANANLRRHMMDLVREGIEVRFTWNRVTPPIRDCIVFGNRAVTYGQIDDVPGQPQRMPWTTFRFGQDAAEAGVAYFDNYWQLGTIVKLPAEARAGDVVPQLRETIKRLASSIPMDTYGTDAVALFDSNHVARLNGRMVGRAIVELRSLGCDWALSSGGCTMCGEIAVTTRGNTIPAEDTVRQLEAVLRSRDFSDHPVLCLYNSGSFFNERELPSKTREQMIRLIAKTPGIQKVILESRPEYLTPDTVTRTTDLLGDISLELGIGLESKDDTIREYCVNKNLTLQQFERFVRPVSGIASILVYVMLKPPFLTEQEAILDAIETARYAVQDIGAAAVSLEPLSQQPHTLVDHLCRSRAIRLPWLWSVLEVARQVHTIAASADAELRIGGWEFLPQPIRTAYNGEPLHECTHGCNEAIRVRIREYNGTGNPLLLENLDYDCIASWRAYIEAEAAPPLQDRITAALETLGTKTDPYMGGSSYQGIRPASTNPRSSSTNNH